MKFLHHIGLYAAALVFGAYLGVTFLERPLPCPPIPDIKESVTEVWVAPEVPVPLKRPGRMASSGTYGAMSFEAGRLPLPTRKGIFQYWKENPPYPSEPWDEWEDFFESVGRDG